MKRTGKNLDNFAKIVKNGELDSLLGIPEMNMKYLMKQTGKNADEITDWLKRNDIDLKDIKPKNVDDIIKGASGAKNSIDDIITDGSHYADGKLKPNSTYKTGEHDYIYKTNSNGVISEAHADLKLKTHDGRLSHNPNTPGKIQGDHAGHLFGDRFGGSPELDNLVSQAQKVNLSEYKVLENKWAKALGEGKSVSVDIKINYDVRGVRPNSFEVKYTIDGVPFKKKITN